MAYRRIDVFECLECGERFYQEGLAIKHKCKNDYTGR